jgi:L-malate glycosyltransferase
VACWTTASSEKRKRKIRILALTKSTGGIALYNKLLLSKLSRHEFESHTLGLSDQAEAYVSALGESSLSGEPLRMARYRIDPVGDFRVLHRILAVAREHRSDVLLCHGSKAGFIGRAVGRVTGLPVVYRQASMPFLSRVQGKRAPLYWALEYAATLFGGHIVTLTEEARRETLARRLVGPERVSVIRTGVDIARFRPQGIRDQVVADLEMDPRRTVVGWMGRLEPQKAPLDFLEALRLLAPRHPDAQFLMAGEGSLREQVLNRVEALGLAGRVRLLPWQTDPARTLQAFDIYVLSSRWEGLPLTLLEAMASGCAVVSTDVDGCAEAIEDGFSGALVRAGQPGALADKLDELLSSPQRRIEYSKAGRRRAVELFDERRMVLEWRALLMRLVQSRPTAVMLGGSDAA